MIRNKRIWERYENGEITEQTPGLAPVVPKFGAELINKIETDIKSFNLSLLENIINALEKKHVLEVHSNLEALESAETSAILAEDKGLEYLYGYIIPIIKAGHNLDSYISAKTASVSKKFRESYDSLQGSKTAADTKIYQQTCRSQSELISSLANLADKRNIDIGADIGQKTVKYLDKYREWDGKCSTLDSKIDTLVEAYRSLELSDKDKKTLRKLRKPVSKSLGMFKGRILKECDSLDYVAGIEQCDNLSSELKYAKGNLGDMRTRKQYLESLLTEIRKLSDDIQSYDVPLSTLQLEKLSSIVDTNLVSTRMIPSMIYFKGREDDLDRLIGASREISNSLFDKQKSYLNDMCNNMSIDLARPVMDFDEVDKKISDINAGRERLHEYKPHFDILRINKSILTELDDSYNSISKNLSVSKDRYVSLRDNKKSLESLTKDTNKYGLSEARLNELSMHVQHANKKAVMSISSLQESYDSEHKQYLQDVELFVDNVIDKVDQMAVDVKANPGMADDVMKYYKKINTFKDISQKIKDYKVTLQSIRPETRPEYAKQPKYVVIKPAIPPEALVSSSIVDQLKLIDLPGDTRYWNIGGILQGKNGIDGWLNRIEHVNKELDKLKFQKNLSRTDYVLNVATIVEDSFKNGYLGEIASINPVARDTIESTIRKLYSFGREVAVGQ